jgi:hypothetical protein
MITDSSCHLTSPARLLVKKWGCAAAIIFNLVQRQRERGLGGPHTPENDMAFVRKKPDCPTPQVMGSPVSTGPFVSPKLSRSLHGSWQAGQ